MMNNSAPENAFNRLGNAVAFAPAVLHNDNVSQIKTPRFPLLRFEEIKAESDCEYLIHGLIPREGLTVMWGPPKCGKSFLMFDAMMHVALGWEYRGRTVEQGPVIYCAFEGSRGVKKRVEAFRQKRLRDHGASVPFYLLSIRVDLIADHKALIAELRTQLNDKSPGAVVLDTLNRSLIGSESKDEDMGAYVAAADAIRDAFQCAVIVVHHCPHGVNRPRGHGSLTGAADAQLAVRREGEEIIFQVEWMKDGREGDQIASRLSSVEIGIDSNGQPITSCVVEACEVPQARPGKIQKLNPKQTNSLRTLQSLTATEGTPLPPAWELPHSIAAVRVDRWREELFKKGVLPSDSKNRRTDFFNLKGQLMSKTLIAEREGMVWRVNP